MKDQDTVKKIVMHIFHIAYKNGRNSKMYSHPKEKERRQKEESLCSLIYPLK